MYFIVITMGIIFPCFLLTARKFGGGRGCVQTGFCYPPQISKVMIARHCVNGHDASAFKSLLNPMCSSANAFNGVPRSCRW